MYIYINSQKGKTLKVVQANWLFRQVKFKVDLGKSDYVVVSLERAILVQLSVFVYNAKG